MVVFSNYTGGSRGYEIVFLNYFRVQIRYCNLVRLLALFYSGVQSFRLVGFTSVLEGFALGIDPKSCLNLLLACGLFYFYIIYRSVLPLRVRDWS
ncbi:hypothetical protein KSS87_017306 [Heliosperma pusillum]|nr:hypothetical protein KSS87_017306 [Heliosperma pusillum]